MKKQGMGIIALMLVASLLLTTAGCAADGRVCILTEKGLSPKPVAATTGDNATQATDFSLRLFQAVCEEGQNTSVSPLSVLVALSMTANGARGNTLAQMEQVLGMDTQELNRYLHDYMTDLPQGEDGALHLANSIWFTDDKRFTVNPDFLQVNADYYGAGIYQAPFDDTTLQDINRWVDTETDGMIPDILDEIPPDALMYLVNALAFEAEWEEMYQKHQVREGIFTLENGSAQTVEFMYSEEGYYLEDENATGLLKYYKGGTYAFVALLPKEGVRVAEYVDSLTGESLHEMLSNPRLATVQAAIPKFEAEYSTDLVKVLSGMGMEDAFSGRTADLTGLGSSTAGNIFISRVLHKTHITVGEQGTKAGAVTVVETKDAGIPEIIDPKTVYLDRPFVYMLIDTESALPFFMGTMMSVNG